MEDIEEVVASYEKFIDSVGQISDRLNPVPLKQVATFVSNCSSVEADLFSSQVVAAFNFCRKRITSHASKEAPSSVSWHTAVQSIVTRMWRKSTKVQVSAAPSPVSSAAPTPTKADEVGQQLVAVESPQGNQVGAAGRQQVQLSCIHVARCP